MLIYARGAAFAVALALVLPAPAVAQFPDLGEKAREVADRLPGLDRAVSRLVDDDPAVTTSMEDAVTEVPFLDGWALAETAYPLAWLRSTRGDYPLAGGDWVFEAQSYCLHAGKHASSGGAGYLYAPLKGDRAPIVRAVLEGSLSHPQIEQRTIQLLIWSILAKTNVDDLAPEVRSAALALLSPEQIFQLNGGALGLVPDRVLRAALEEVPEPVQKVMEAEARLREILTGAAVSYEDAERAAMLPGAPPPAPDRHVPAERWSYHPEGYFVRFDPSGYSKTRWEIAMPTPAVIVRDSRGRIARVDDPHGRRLDVSYPDTASLVGPAGFGVEPTEARRFSELRLTIQTRENEDDPPETATWSGVAASPGAADRAQGALDEVRNAAAIGPHAPRGETATRLRADFRDLSLLASALDGVERSDPRAAEAADAVERARMWTACRILGGCEQVLVPPRMEEARGPASDRAVPGGSVDGARSAAPGRSTQRRSSFAAASFSPSGTVAVPANPSSQRLAQSGRPSGGGPGGPGGPDGPPFRSDPNAGPDTDWDDDGIPNHSDDDADGDDVPDIVDPDRDGDGDPNRDDVDWDNDGIPNMADDDADGDGLPDIADGDRDGDGNPNDADWDHDEDGNPNVADSDVDGDAIPNIADTDIDGDGIPNAGDADADGDGMPNAGDPDADGDGIPNQVDWDENGDGIAEPRDPRTGLKY